MSWNSPVFVTVVTGLVAWAVLAIATAVTFGVMMHRADEEEADDGEWT